MVTLAAVLAIFAYALTAPLLGVLLPSYSLHSDQQGGLALSNAVGLVVASLSAGPAVDLRGKKPVLVAGLGLLLAALFCALNSGGYSDLLLVYFTLGLEGGAVVNGANSLVVGDISPRRRGAALNFLNLFFGLGGIVTTFAASYALKPVALCKAVALVVSLALATNATVKMPQAIGTARIRWHEVSVLLSQPTLILFSLLLSFYVACEVGVWNWLKIYLIAAGFQAAAAGGVVSYGFAFGMLTGRLWASRILTKAPPIAVILASGTLMAITLIATLNFKSQVAVTAAVFSTGLAMAPVFPTTLGMVSNRFPSGTATAMGVAIASGWLGLAVSSPVIGAAAASGTLQHALFLLPTFAGAMVLVGLVLWSSLGKTVGL